MTSRSNHNAQQAVRPSRRHFLRAIGAGGAAALLTACGAAPQAAAPTGAPMATDAPATTNAPAPTASTAADYPRSVKDTAGIDVSIAARPRRVVALSNMWDLDALLSLDIAPITFGIRAFVGEYTGSPRVSWTWHEDRLKRLNATAERINGDETNIEVVAAAQPDLIVAMSWALENTRDELAQLAPVIQVVPNWRESLKVVGQAFALGEQAESIIADTDQRIATSLQDLNLDKPTLALISCYDNTAFYGFGHPADGRADLFQRAGFSLLDVISAKATAAAPVPEFSIELLPSLEPAAVVVLFDYGSDGVQPSGILDNPLFKQLPAVAAGRLVVLKQGELAQGLSTISPLNVEFCLDVVRQAGKLLA